MRNDCASRTPAEAALVSALAALRSGFFSSAMLAACCKESGEGSSGAWDNIVPVTQKTATTNRRIGKERRPAI